MTLLKTGLFRYICSFMPTIPDRCHDCIFNHMQVFFIRNRAYTTEITILPSRIRFRDSTAQYCSDLPPHSQNQPTDLNPLFHSIMLKPLFSLFLAFETASMQSQSKVYQYPLKENILLIQCKTQPTLMNPCH